MKGHNGMIKTLEVKIPVSVPDGLAVIGVVNIKNGCCNDRPVLITANHTHNGGINYACQCSCGCWCTTGHRTVSDAVKDYEHMNEGRRDYAD